MKSSDYLFSTICILVSVAIFSGIALLAKMLGTGRLGDAIHPFQISSCRFLFAFLAVAIATAWIRPKFVNVPWKLHLKRSVFGWLGISFLLAAAMSIPLADANAISFLSVIISMGLSVVMLQENVGIRRWSAAFVALIGALVIARPGASAFHPAAILALASAFFIGVESIYIKILSSSEKPIQILFLNNVFGSLVSLCVIPFVWLSPNPVQWIALAGVGFLMALAQFFNILALSKSDISFVAPFWYGAPLFAVVYDFFLFDHLITFWSAVGIGLIACGGIIITYRENQARRASSAT